MNDIARYNDGREIRIRDIVQIDDQWQGVVEEIILLSNQRWAEYCEENGEGVMLTGAPFGRIFVGLDGNELVLKHRMESNLPE